MPLARCNSLSASVSCVIQHIRGTGVIARILAASSGDGPRASHCVEVVPTSTTGLGVMLPSTSSTTVSGGTNNSVAKDMVASPHSSNISGGNNGLWQNLWYWRRLLMLLPSTKVLSKLN